MRKNFSLQEVAFTVLLTPKETEWHASDSYFDLAGQITRDPMEKPDPYGEWVLQKVQLETGGNKAPYRKRSWRLRARLGPMPLANSNDKVQLAKQ